MLLDFIVVLKNKKDNRFYAYKLAYRPCPIWTSVDEKEEIVNLHPHYAYYLPGDFKKLLSSLSKESTNSWFEPDIKCLVIAANNWVDTGYEEPNALNKIIDDIKNTGFDPVLLTL